jgi:Domain of unknown function (DUF4328)
VTALPAVGVSPARIRLPRFTALSWLVVFALILCAAADLAAVVLDLSYHHAILRLENGDIFSLGSAQAADDRQRAIGLTQLALFVVTAVFFIAWFHRAYKNVRSLGVSAQRFPTGWAIGAWFVPFLNLVRPKAIANDIWRGSEPTLGEGSIVALVDVPWFVTAWWAMFILASVASRISFQTTGRATSLSALATATNVAMVSDAIDLAAALLAAFVVYRVFSRQRARAEAFALRGAPVAPLLADRP